jgi:hypothetical protein
MKRALLISLSLVLALVGWSTVGADDGFYVIPAMKGNYAPVTRTGQMQSYTAGDDGDLHKGLAWPTPRFTDHQNGTVTDNLTGLIWMKNTNAFGGRTWTEAISTAATVANGIGGVADGSNPGDWRLPNVRELASLPDFSRNVPPLPENHPFTGVESVEYWSSTTCGNNADAAWFVHFHSGAVVMNLKSNGYYVWCVRGGR